MGVIRTAAGTEIQCDEVDGTVTLEDVYKEIKTSGYTDGHRIRMMAAAGKLGRQAWGVLPTLHEISKGMNSKLAEAAERAIAAIDPGRPKLQKTEVSGTSFRDTPNGIEPFGTERPQTYAHAPTGGTSVVKQNPGVGKVDNRFPVTNSYGNTVYKTPEIKKVTFTDLDGDLEDHARLYGTCLFCDKYTIFPKQTMEAAARIAGPDKDGNRRLFCNFCLRNEFYKKRHQQNTLVMSYRGIIGYYYYCFHAFAKQGQGQMWLTDLQGMIELHVKIGVQNPLFRYDPETLCWFVDFSKIGTHKRQMPLSYVLDTASACLSAFSMYEHCPGVSPAGVFNKFKEAMVDFQHHRRRPPGKRILVPTLSGCGIPTDYGTSNKAIPDTWLRNFVPGHMLENHQRNKSRGYCNM